MGEIERVPEFWHMNSEGEGASGPFFTIEEAKKDALKYLHSSRWGVSEVVILKVVSVSKTAISYDTVWEDQ